MNAVCSASARSAGTPRRRRERQRHEERLLGELDQRERLRVAGELATGWHVGQLREPSEPSELHQRAQLAAAPQVALPGLDRAEAHHLAVELAALHRQEHGRSARIAAHQIHVQAQDLLGDEREHEVGGARPIGSQVGGDAGLPEIGDALRRVPRVHHHEVGVVDIGRQAAEPGEPGRIEVGVGWPWIASCGTERPSPAITEPSFSATLKMRLPVTSLPAPGMFCTTMLGCAGNEAREMAPDQPAGDVVDAARREADDQRDRHAPGRTPRRSAPWPAATRQGSERTRAPRIARDRHDMARCGASASQSDRPITASPPADVRIRGPVASHAAASGFPRRAP